MSARAQQMTSNTARRAVPGFFLAVGVACLTAATVGGHLALGLVTFGILAASSLALEAIRIPNVIAGFVLVGHELGSAAGEFG
ncbi:hypothetical protein AB0A70_26365 [Streptomyces morookaense]|uniref:hypothetical protein n=1 Tax=Streptomyces morookaense TaxID=1970 RepID=UPI0033C16CCC